MTLKEEVVRALKGESDRAQQGQGRGGGEQDRRNGRWLDPKKFVHMRVERFGGKDGGSGWSTFFEDLLVTIGSVSIGLEQAVKRVTDLEGVGKAWTTREEVKGGVGPELWDQYSGELYARVLELTKEEAQRMVRNEGV